MGSVYIRFISMIYVANYSLNLLFSRKMQATILTTPCFLILLMEVFFNIQGIKRTLDINKST